MYLAIVSLFFFLLSIAKHTHTQTQTHRVDSGQFEVALLSYIFVAVEIEFTVSVTGNLTGSRVLFLFFFLSAVHKLKCNRNCCLLYCVHFVIHQHNCRRSMYSIELSRYDKRAFSSNFKFHFWSKCTIANEWFDCKRIGIGNRLLFCLLYFFWLTDNGYKQEIQQLFQ